jgi:hypothetical protein
VAEKGRRLTFPEDHEVRPELPELPQLRQLCARCWDQDPRRRPPMSEVAEGLNRLLEAVRDRARRAAQQAHSRGTPGEEAAIGTAGRAGQTAELTVPAGSQGGTGLPAAEEDQGAQGAPVALATRASPFATPAL